MTALNHKRIILTFENVHFVLAAEKRLRNNLGNTNAFRTTPTPENITEVVCGMSLEILNHDKKDEILALLSNEKIKPTGVHYL